MLKLYNITLFNSSPRGEVSNCM